MVPASVISSNLKIGPERKGRGDMARKPRARERITLSYLDESERNPTHFSWDAKDNSGRDYHITYRYKTLAVSGPDDFSFVREGVASSGSTYGRDRIIELTADIFDASLLRLGKACRCGFVNDPRLDPRLCINCGAELRVRRIISIRKAGEAMPSWLINSVIAPFSCWRAKDEEDGEVWIQWSATVLEIFDPMPGGKSSPAPKIAHSLDWPHPEEKDVDGRMMIEVELSGRYTFHGIESVE